MYNSNRSSIWSQIPPVTKNLLIINVIIWLFMVIAPQSIAGKVYSYGSLHYVGASLFNAYQFITYMFLHSLEPTHILFNMFGLFMFGPWIERSLGSGRFLFYYLTCGVGAGLIQEGAWYLTVDSFIGGMYGVASSEVETLIAESRLDELPMVLNLLMTVGASGAIFGVLLAFGMLFPNMRLSIMFLPVFVKAKWMVIGYGVIELLVGMSNANDGVAHFAHLGGMIFGLLLLLYWKKRGVINGPYY